MYRIIHAIYSLTRDWKLDFMELRLPSAALTLSLSVLLFLLHFFGINSKHKVNFSRFSIVKL